MEYVLIVIITLASLAAVYIMNKNTKDAGYLYEKSWYKWSYIITAVIIIIYLLKVGVSPSTTIVSMLIPAMAVLSFIDLKLYIIPNRLNLYLAISAILYIIVNYKIAWILLMGGVVYFALFFFIAIFTGGSLGMGDVKMMFSVGAILGITLLLKYIAFSFILAMIVGLFLVISKKKKATDKIPFGPYLTIGFVLTILSL